MSNERLIIRPIRDRSSEFSPGPPNRFFQRRPDAELNAPNHPPSIPVQRGPIDPPEVELLAPAGNDQAATAAIENGADAIYFGLDCGFNARHRAANFHVDDLPALMRRLRHRGVRGYATMNTLVFPSEMDAAVDVIRRIADSGVDAVLVQDFGLARLIRDVCTDIEIHASTQMSLTSAETIAVAAELGLARVVLARELSIAEIRKITAATTMPVEVFIHGALCVAYSGQCLTSESLGGRSANRGQCAQACRLPYELVCDGQTRDLGDVRYLLSPQDLAGIDVVDQLIGAGVASLKIEGRLKTPEYVAGMTSKYREAIDAAIDGRSNPIDTDGRREMELSFSRGFSSGWLEGNDHKRLVPGLTSAKQGIALGEVEFVSRHQITVDTDVPVRPGDGIAVMPQSGATIGSRVYQVDRFDGLTVLDLGRGFDTTAINIGDRVFKNDDPALNRRLRESFAGPDPGHRRRVDVRIVASIDSPLEMHARIGGVSVSVRSDDVTPAARNRPSDAAMVREKFGSLGGTVYQIASLDIDIAVGVMVPASMIKTLRRSLVESLDERLSERGSRSVHQIDRSAIADADRRAIQTAIADRSPSHSAARLNVLCRTPEQLDAVLRWRNRNADRVGDVMVDFHDVRRYGEAVAAAHAAGARLVVAPVRMQKPGEMGLLKVLLRTPPDALLVRNLAALRFAVDHDIDAIADFSLNVTNVHSARWLIDQGVRRVTASYDLNSDQLTDFLTDVPAAAVEIVVHQHMPMFHMEHCVFCSVLSPGTNKTNCGRPCDDHGVGLRDRVGHLHVLHADVACRNTLYNARPQSGAEIIERSINRGVRHFRIELLNHDADQIEQTLTLYADLLSGQTDARSVWQTLSASNQLGVTRGTLESKKNPLEVL